MNALDIIILIPLAIGAYKGYKKGFVLEVVAILSFVLAILGAFKLLQVAIDFAKSEMGWQGQWVPLVSFIVLFIAIIWVVNAIGNFVKKTLDLTLLGSADNLIGGVMGMLKWAFGLSVLLWLIQNAGFELPASFTDGSLLYPYFELIAPEVAAAIAIILPFLKDLFEQIKDYFDATRL